MFIECESRGDVLDLLKEKGSINAVLLVGLDASEYCRLTEIQSLRKKMHRVTAHQMTKTENEVDVLIRHFTAIKEEYEDLKLQLQEVNAGIADSSKEARCACSSQTEQDKSQQQSDDTDAASMRALKASFNLTQKPQR